MGFITRSLKVLMLLFIIYIVVGILDSAGVHIFGREYFTEVGFAAFMAAIFLEVTFSLHK